jgi:hypothetical protein
MMTVGVKRMSSASAAFGSLATSISVIRASGR